MFPVTRRRYTAWVLFSGADHRRFWRMFTKPGWRHCFLILPAYYPEPGLMADQYSVIVNPTTNRIEIDVVFMPPAECVDKLLKSGIRCAVKFRVDTNHDRDYVPRGFLTCVSLIKSILGIRAWAIITPERLASWLLRNGGELIERRVDDGKAIRD